ncbi:hypothetical protein [Ferruginibacter sp.]
MGRKIKIKKGSPKDWLASKFVASDSITTETNAKGDEVVYNYYTAIKFITSPVNYFFLTLFIFAAIALFYISIRGLCIIFTCNYENVKGILEGVEFIFISPLPLLIVAAFHNYYKKIIIPIVDMGKTDNKDYSRLTNVENEKSKSQSLVDMGIIKYIFISIIVSTVFIVLLGEFVGHFPAHDKSSETHSLSVESKKTESLDSLPNLKNPTIENIKKENTLKKDVDFTLFKVCFGIILLILLLIYFKMIGKNLNEDIHNSIRIKNLVEATKDDIMAEIKE